MSRAGLNRATGLATLTLVIATEIADCDEIMSFGGPVIGFGSHRGFTHTFLGAPVMAALTLGIVYGIDRIFLRRGREQKAKAGLPPRWGLLYLYGLLGALAHILLDFTNSYGVRPLAPFNPRWYAWDIIYIVEPLLTGALALALIAPWFFGLINQEVGARRPAFPGRGSAIAALIFMLMLWGVRDYNHRTALELLNMRDYKGEAALRASAFPYPINPFRWYSVVETRDFLQTQEVDTWKNEVDPQRAAIMRYKPEETPVTLAAKASPLGRIYLDWARYPYTRVEMLQPEGSGAEVGIFDLRYAYPGRSGTVLSMSVKVTPQLDVVAQRMGPRH